jgi:hypothetical protein
MAQGAGTLCAIFLTTWSMAWAINASIVRAKWRGTRRRVARRRGIQANSAPTCSFEAELERKP